MQPKVIELRQDRYLFKSNFDGYKLSLESLPILKQELDQKPFTATTSEEQFSFLHVELFSLYNYLVRDLWNRGSVYYVGKDGSIIKIQYSKCTHLIKTPFVVYTLPSLNNHTRGDFPVSFRLLNANFCILCDGGNKFYLFDTGNRDSEVKWSEIFKGCISSEKQRYIIRYARIDLIDSKQTVTCLFQSISCKDRNYITDLTWCTLTEDKDSDFWKYELKDVISTKGNVNYCALEEGSQSVLIACHNELHFKSKSLPEKITSEPSTSIHPGIGEILPYTWSQTKEDVTIKFNCRDSKDKHDYKVLCTGHTISVKFKDEILLEDELCEKVEADFTTYSLENDFIQITLAKKEINKVWKRLTASSPLESFEAGNSTLLHNSEPVSHLEDQVEECDLPMNQNEDEYIIERLDMVTKLTTHKIFLGGYAPLFVTNISNIVMPVIVTRQDVDACCWAPNEYLSGSNDWKMIHRGNLPAFGYVLASKEQKKFTDCSPDINYAVICENQGHVFIYKSNEETELRNRVGPQVKIGKQHLITLKDEGQVLGMVVEDFVTTLLTEKCIICIEINDSK